MTDGLVLLGLFPHVDNFHGSRTHQVCSLKWFQEFLERASPKGENVSLFLFRSPTVGHHQLTGAFFPHIRETLLGEGIFNRDDDVSKPCIKCTASSGILKLYFDRYGRWLVNHWLRTEDT